MTTPFVIGRMIFGGFFLYNGINHFVKKDMLSQYAAAKQVPAAEAAVMASGALLLVGGASMITGVQPKMGAAAIAAFLAGVSPMMHDFWRAADENQRSNDMIHFMKNMALLGGALALTGIDEPWPASLSRGPRALADGREREIVPVR